MIDLTLQCAMCGARLRSPREDIVDAMYRTGDWPEDGRFAGGKDDYKRYVCDCSGRRDTEPPSEPIEYRIIVDVRT